MKIAFADDAFETFERIIDEMPGYVAAVTTADGKTFDVELRGIAPAPAAAESDQLKYRTFDEAAGKATGPIRRLSLMELEEVRIY